MKINRLLVGTLALIIIISAFPAVFAGNENPIGPNGETCTLIDFEGVGNSVGPPIIIGDATFTGGVLASVDSDAGGGGNFANEPSPDTIIFLNPPPPIITLTFANPVSQLNWFYAAFAQTDVRFFDSGNGLLATVNPPNLPQGGVGGDPNGSFDNWGMASHSEGANTIKKVEFEIIVGSGAGFDNIEFCIIDTVVGGEFLPIDTTTLLLAGVQTPMAWMVYAFSAIGIGAFLFTRNPNNMRNIKVILRDYLDRF